MSSDASVFDDGFFDKRTQLERWFGSADAADDTLQAVAEKLIKSGDRPHQGYLTVMLRNAGIDAIRSETRRRGYEEGFAESVEIVDLLSPERVMAGSQGLKALELALDRLSPTNRKIFVLAYIEELPRTEIATTLGLKLSTVEKRLSKAKAQCYAQVKEHLE